MTLSFNSLKKALQDELHATSVVTSIESICKRTRTNSDSLRLIGKGGAFQKLFGRLVLLLSRHALFSSLPVNENRCCSAGRILGDMIT